MHNLDTLKDKLCDQLESYASKEITASNLEYIDKLAHAAKNVAKLCDGGEYSGAYPVTTYAMRRDYPRRDSMGRYSESDGMLHELRELRKHAPDDRTRKEFDRFIEKMEMMG